jgi:hypothetical protein
MIQRAMPKARKTNCGVEGPCFHPEQDFRPTTHLGMSRCRRMKLNGTA